MTKRCGKETDGMNRGKWKILLKSVSVAGVLLSVVLYMYGWRTGIFTSQDRLQQYIAGFGAGGAAVFVMFQALHHQEAMLKGLRAEITCHNAPDAELVHINTVFPDAPLAAFFAHLRGQKVIYYGHSTREDFRNSFRLSNVLAPLFGKWIKFCYKTGDAVITPTEYSRRLLLGYGIRRPVYVLSNGIDTGFYRADAQARSAFREKYGLRETDRAVLSAGHYMVRKGILDFIRLARELPEVRFFWFGYTSPGLLPASVRDAIRTAPENLTFPGYVSQEELREAYCGCDLFCFMSYEETEGIVVLEALSSGIPVLLRDIPVYQGWLTDGENVYKARDAESFRKKTELILEGRVRDLTQRGRQTAENRSIEKTGQALLAIYRSLGVKVKVQEAGRKRPAAGLFS